MVPDEVPVKTKPGIDDPQEDINRMTGLLPNDDGGDLDTMGNGNDDECGSQRVRVLLFYGKKHL